MLAHCTLTQSQYHTEITFHSHNLCALCSWNEAHYHSFLLEWTFSRLEFILTKFSAQKLSISFPHIPHFREQPLIAVTLSWITKHRIGQIDG